MGEPTLIHKKVLLIDSNCSHLAILSKQIQKKYSLSVANCIDDALAIIDAGAPIYFILLDLLMPGQRRNGIDLIRILRNRNYPLPLIATSESAAPETSALAIKEGATFFIDKNRLISPVSPTLETTLEEIEKEVRNFHEEYIKEKELIIRATIDPKTRLFNRATFDYDLEEEISRYNRAVFRELNYYISLFLVDINDMKNANDHLGHPYVDANLLGTLGQVILKELMRKRLDKGYRFGGDEAVVLLPYTNLEGTCIVAQRIINGYDSCRKSFTYQQYQRLVGEPCSEADFQRFRDEYGTLSLGVAEAPRKKIPPSELIIMADKAMYHAKIKAKSTIPPSSTIVSFEPSMAYPSHQHIEQLSRKTPAGQP